MFWIQTLEGFPFDLENPEAGKISPGAISTGLSRLCRYLGHCLSFYSVAQHSILVESLVDDPELKLPALLHDANELYTGFGDVSGPAKQLLKHHFGSWLKNHEQNVNRAIAARFGFDPKLFDDTRIKLADRQVGCAEHRDLMAPCSMHWSQEDGIEPMKARINPLPMKTAEIVFWQRLADLISERNT